MSYNLENTIDKFIKENNLFTLNDKLLLAVSGGRDSMVMLEVLRKLGYKIAIAHCNFKLRGKHADDDEKFVETIALNHHLKFHSKSFNTKGFAKKNKISIQMAARQLRYNWFNELIAKYKYNYLLTAHHLDDHIETVLLNLTRGTGLKGLTGISAKTQNIRRPLLCVDRNEIDTYVNETKLPFREDHSNEQTYYARNKIRHKVLPVLKEINPSLTETIRKEAVIINSIKQLLIKQLDIFKKKNVKTLADGCEIKVGDWINDDSKIYFINEVLKNYNFTSDEIWEISEMLDKQPGKFLKSKNYVFLVDRDKFIVKLKRTTTKKKVIIHSPKDFLKVALEYELLEAPIVIEKRNDFAYIDYNKLSFPLILDTWEKGDKFIPLGMKHYKKLSDFFVDNKIPLLEKNTIQILRNSNQEIIWIVGHRLDERYKITDQTQKILFLKKKS